jgi:hypothetical protein
MGLTAPAEFLRGPAQAADLLVDGSPQRILYCGSSDGNFVFAARARDPELRTQVISGDKLSAGVFSPAEFEKFAHRFGIEYVVLERSPRPRPYDVMATWNSRALVWDRDIPLVSSRPRWKGVLTIYRFTNPSPNPEETISLMMPRFLGGAAGDY